MKVFEKLDKNENGLVDVDDISDNYIVDRHPDFIEGQKMYYNIIIINHLL